MRTFRERFEAKIDKHPRHGGCWLWTACRNEKGYGLIKVDGKNVRAPRASYKLYVGPIPEHDSHHGMCVCHKCDNPPCVNPDHLFLGTMRDNLLDKIHKGRDESRRLTAVGHTHSQGTKHPFCKLSEADVWEILQKIESGQKQTSVAAEFGLSEGNVSMIKTGERWNHLTHRRQGGTRR